MTWAESSCRDRRPPHRMRHSECRVYCRARSSRCAAGGWPLPESGERNALGGLRLGGSDRIESVNLLGLLRNFAWSIFGTITSVPNFALPVASEWDSSPGIFGFPTTLSSFLCRCGLRIGTIDVGCGENGTAKNQVSGENPSNIGSILPKIGLSHAIQWCGACIGGAWFPRPILPLG